MVTAKPVIGPSGGAAQRLVLHDRRVRKQGVRAAVVLEPFVCAQPDAVAEAGDLAAAVARAATPDTIAVAKLVPDGTRSVLSGPSIALISPSSRGDSPITSSPGAAIPTQGPATLDEP